MADDAGQQQTPTHGNRGGVTPEEQARRERIAGSARRVAVIGLSSNPRRGSHLAAAGLLRGGIEVLPVSPKGGEVLGLHVYTALEDVPGPIDVVDVFRPSEEAPGWARRAVAVGAGVLWLQKGIRSEEARAVAEEAGLEFVEDVCLKRTLVRMGRITPDEDDLVDE